MDTDGNGGNRAAATVDPALYQNLVDMIPLVETFLERRHGGGGGGTTTLAHHAAPMVYTRAPSSRGNGFSSSSSSRKSFESPGSKYKRPGGLSQHQRTPAERCLEMEGGGGGGDDLHSPPMWEEGHNILWRVEADEDEETTELSSSSLSPYHLRQEIEELKQQLCEKDTLLQSYGRRQQQQHPPPMDTTTTTTTGKQLREIEELRQKLKERDSFLETLVNKNSKESHQLQSELEELKRKVCEKERALENTVKHTSAEIAASRVAWDRDVLRLQTQVGELQQEVWEKKRITQSAQIQLSEKQQELGKMRLLLDRMEVDMARTNYQAASIEAEVIGLRCQVSTLQFQLNAVDAAAGAGASGSCPDGNRPQIFKGQNGGGPGSCLLLWDVSEESKENMELARRQYLAAVIAAREVSGGGGDGDEPLVLVKELRKNLQAFVRKPSLLETCGGEY